MSAKDKSASAESDYEPDDDEVLEEEEELEMEDDTQRARDLEPVRRPGPFRRFVRSVFSHVVFAGLIFAAAGYFGYLNDKKIMRDVGDTVCATTALGGFMSKPGDGTKLAGKTVGTSTAPAAPAGNMPSANAAGDATSAQNAAAGSGGQNSTVLPAGRTPTTVVIAAKNNPVKTPAASKTETNKQVALNAPKNTTPPGDNQAAAGAPTQSPATPKPMAGQAGEQAAVEPATSPDQPKPAKDAAPAVTTDETAPAPAQTSQPSPQPSSVVNTQNSAPADPAALAAAWKQARQAYVSGRPGADKTYKQLIERFPDVPDLPGELGNIYYRQGRLSEAAEQFYEAAMRLIQSNQPAKAACLLPVLKRIDPGKAAALARQTNQTCPGTK